MKTLPSQQTAPLLLSRRTVLRHLGGLVLVGGGLAPFISACSSSSPAPTTSQTPTSHPVGALLFTYKGHDAGIAVVTWSPDGKRIASSADTTIQIWDASTGSQILTFRYAAGVSSVAWSPDGRHQRAASSSPIVAIVVGRLPWPGPPMARASPREIAVEKCKCGRPNDLATARYAHV
jgi:WD40 repeat protein